MSDANVNVSNLPKSKLPFLKCHSCSSYLNVSPIICYDQDKYFCGRCSDKIPLENTPIRVGAYEAIAKLFRYPCKNTDNGCKELLTWDCVSKHEDECEYIDYSCPSLPLQTCDWKGTLTGMVEHFKECHRNLIAKLTYFHPPLKRIIEENKIIQVHSQTFLFQILNDVNSSHFWCGVSSIGKSMREKFSYQMEIKNVDKGEVIYSQSVKIKPKMKWNIDKNEMIELNINNIKAQFDTSNILIRVFIKALEEKPEPDLSNQIAKLKTVSKSMDNLLEESDLLRELECPICFKLMMAPIFICPTGHSICGDCKKQTLQCPFCKLKLGDSRNYTLEKITNFVCYPCPNQHLGCTHTSLAGVMKAHELTCALKQFFCPLKQIDNCSWAGVANEIYTHVTANHHNNMQLKLRKNIIFNLLSKKLSNTQIVKVDGTLFMIFCKRHGEPGPMQWSVQQIGVPAEMTKFKFIIEFIDSNMTGHKFIIHTPLQECEERNTACFLTIPYHLINPMINNKQQVTLSFDIKKVE